MDLTDIRWQAGERGTIVPDPVDVERMEVELLTAGPKCPAATLGTYADSGRVYVKCGVEKNSFAVADSAVAAIQWCCGDYAGADSDRFGPCPVWQAEQENDPALQRTYAAQEQAATDALTAEQIASGIRVDDKGHDPSLPTGTREVIEAIEEVGNEGES